MMNAVLLSQPWGLWTIIVPLALAVTAFLFPRRAPLAGIITALSVPLFVAAAFYQLFLTGPNLQMLGGWQAPLGITLRTDGPALILLLTSGLVGLVVSLYAAGYFTATDHQERRQQRYFWPFWLLLWGACNALFLSRDLFNLYVTLELVTLSSVALAALSTNSAALDGAMRYLLTGLLGSLSYLLGVALIYGAYGTVDLVLLGQTVRVDGLSRAALALMTVGLLAKTALFPLHFWLPPAHASAPAPVSALLSGLVVKAPLLILFRLWFEVFPAVTTAGMAHLLGSLGCIAIIWGSLLALRQQRLKLLVAYSTVAQIGYFFLLFPLARGETAATAWAGALLLVLAHGCSKAALFLVCGTITRLAGHDRLADLAGAGGTLGARLLVFALAAVTLVGLPPSSGFIAKWLLINAAIVSGHWWYLATIALGTLLASGYVLRVLSLAFIESQVPALPVAPRILRWPPLALSIVALLLGLAAFHPAVLTLVGAPVSGIILLEMVP
jgi:multicomponent Na+:H+ antiporter subunit D